jgi:hypothetical protein
VYADIRNYEELLGDVRAMRISVREYTTDVFSNSGNWKYLLNFIRHVEVPPAIGVPEVFMQAEPFDPPNQMTTTVAYSGARKQKRQATNNRSRKKVKLTDINDRRLHLASNSSSDQEQQPLPPRVSSGAQAKARSTSPDSVLGDDSDDSSKPDDEDQEIVVLDARSTHQIQSTPRWQRRKSC